VASCPAALALCTVEPFFAKASWPTALPRIASPGNGVVDAVSFCPFDSVSVPLASACVPVPAAPDSGSSDAFARIARNEFPDGLAKACEGVDKPSLATDEWMRMLRLVHVHRQHLFQSNRWLAFVNISF
jgi:hypothetical protein